MKHAEQNVRVINDIQEETEKECGRFRLQTVISYHLSVACANRARKAKFLIGFRFRLSFFAFSRY